MSEEKWFGRQAQIFISYKTQARLRRLAEALPSLGRNADEVADNLLHQLIIERFSHVLEVEKRIREIEKEYAQRLMREAHEDETLNPKEPA